MKKKILFVLPILMLVLTGCGKEETGQVVCTLKSNDVVSGYQIESKYTINYKGDFVKSVETVETVTSESQKFLSAFESTIKDSYKKADEAYGGYTYDVKKDGNKVISTVTIDYSSMNLKKFIEDQPILKSYTENNKLKTSGAKVIYENLGATCE